MWRALERHVGFELRAEVCRFCVKQLWFDGAAYLAVWGLGQVSVKPKE